MCSLSQEQLLKPSSDIILSGVKLSAACLHHMRACSSVRHNRPHTESEGVELRGGYRLEFWDGMAQRCLRGGEKSADRCERGAQCVFDKERRGGRRETD